jgi:hypothetical protein
MSGGSKASNDYYYLPNVMYFYKAYALHGTYWHHNFRRPMSRGCANLSFADAESFFDWAEIGTPVVTHNRVFDRAILPIEKCAKWRFWVSGVGLRIVHTFPPRINHRYAALAERSFFM